MNVIRHVVLIVLALACVHSTMPAAAQSQLYCYQPSDDRAAPTCALTYETCQALVLRFGGGCHSMPYRPPGR
jgi:hypothetical protein